MHIQRSTITRPGLLLAVLLLALFAARALPAYAAAPSISGLSVNTGSTLGGTQVVITGTAFTGVVCPAGVTFGGTAATSCTVDSSTQITAVSPPHAPGPVDIIVTHPTEGASSGAGSGDNFTYGAPPTVTFVTPNFCTTAGGTSITISGTNLTGATVVNFGAATATPTTISATSITVNCPASAVDGSVDVRVTTPFGQSENGAADNFLYTFGTPTVTGLSPKSGLIAGGTVVTITGTGFTGTPTVTFGGTAGTAVTVNSSTSITATAPLHAAGIVDVIVQTANGTSANTPADDFFYGTAGPAVTGLAPATGPIAGGTVVAITGTNLGGATGVTFDGVAATSVTVNSATQITATSPAGAVGPADVIVTSALGVSANTGADDFTYTNAPVVSTVAPAQGPVGGGTVVVITGTGFTGATSVTFGGTPGTGLAVNSPTQITVTSPAHGAGTVDVLVTTPQGTSTNTAADNFLYGSPTIASISPAQGPVAGGTTVTITGTGFTGATAVMFGTTAATSFNIVSDTSITAVAPAGANGVVRVSVVTPLGTTADTAADNFTYGTGATITYTLYFRWTLIVWNGKAGADIAAALKGLESPDNPLTNDVSGIVTAVYHFNNAQQRYEAWFPGSANVPGANDISTFVEGQGYWIAISAQGQTNWTVPTD